MNEPNFDQFLSQYRKLHPANIPVRPKAVSRYPGWLRFAVGAMFVAAGLISAVHTIPTVYASIEAKGVIPEAARILAAVLSPVAVELAILIAAYAFQRGSRLVVGAMLFVAFSVALVSNISSSIRAFAENGDASSSLVGIALGIGLPLIALVAGILFSNIYEAFVEAEREADRLYKADCLTYDAAVRDAWDGHLQRLEAQRAAAEERQRQQEEKRAEAERAERLKQERRERRRERRESSSRTDTERTDTERTDTPERADGQRTDSGQRPVSGRTTDGQKRVIEYLDQNPDRAEDRVRDLAAALNIGKTTAADGINAWKLLRMPDGQGALQSNGHGNTEL